MDWTEPILLQAEFRVGRNKRKLLDLAIPAQPIGNGGVRSSSLVGRTIRHPLLMESMACKHC
jgi:hypothetical protein